MPRTRVHAFLRAFLSGGLVLSLLTLPTFTPASHGANAACSPTPGNVDSRIRVLKFDNSSPCDWVIPQGWVNFTLEMTGGGGGGGGGSWAGTTGGGGGGGGAASRLRIDVGTSVGAVVTINIGAGGAGGSGASSKGITNGNNGVAGALSTFSFSQSDSYTAKGGSGGSGASSDTGGAGGTGGALKVNSTVFAEVTGGAQNSGNGGEGKVALTGGVSATSTAPGVSFTAQGQSSIRGLSGGGGGARTGTTTPSGHSNSNSIGGTSTDAAKAGLSNTGSGGGGGAGCSGASDTCANGGGANGAYGYVILIQSFAIDITNQNLNSSDPATSTGKFAVGVTPTFPTIVARGHFGTITYAVNPALPAGLSFNTSTGVLSGVPSAASPQTVYRFSVYDGVSYEFSNGWLLQVNKGTSGSLSFSDANIVYGVPAALAASGGSGTGAITFSTSSSDCVLSGTRGETVTAQKASGTCAITAQRAGDDNWYTTSKSATFTMTKEVSTVSLTASPSSPKEEGSSITLTATTGAGQTGTVTFSAGGSPISSCGSSGAVTISGTSAVCIWTPSASGSPFTVGASYSGDSNYQSATASTLSYTIYPSISLSYPGISTSFGTSKTSTPTINGGTGSTSSWTWSVAKVSDSSAVSGITVDSSGVVTASSSVSTGTYAMRVTATDSVGVTKIASINVVVGLSSAASPSLTSAESSMTAGGVVHLTASVLSAATGTIAFKYGSTTITGCATVAIASGLATCEWTTTSATGSPFSVTAVYSGDSSYSTATSAAISITVIAAATFSYTSQNKVFGAGATVTPTTTGGAGGLNTWTVVNSADSNSLVGVIINQAGVISISSNLGVGSYTVNIAANDANGVAGAGTLEIVITQATTTMTLSARTITNQTLTAGTLGRQIRLVATFNVPVMGSITFSDARGTICNAFASNFVGECWWAPSDATYSPYAITASFGGNSNGTAATSNTISNFTWNAPMSVSHADTRVETGKTVSLTPTVSGGTGSPSSWNWGISQYLTGNSIGGITINSSGVISISGSILPDTYTMVVGSGDLAGTFYYNNVTITVSDLVAPDILISSTSETVTAGSAITGYTITNTGSDVTSYEIDQSLPSGLSFSASSGRITGTPTETATSLAFTLTANNFAGQDTATFTLTISASGGGGGGGGGGATITISLTGGATTAAKGSAITISATISVSGKVKFLANGKVIGGCASKSGSSSATCSWKPTVQGQSVALTAILNPTSSSYSNVRSPALNVGVGRRTGPRG